MVPEICRLEDMLPDGVAGLGVSGRSISERFGNKFADMPPIMPEILEMASARQDLKQYLKTGRHSINYKDGRVPAIDLEVLRDMVLRAGYTEFALLMPSMGIVEVKGSNSDNGMGLYTTASKPNYRNVALGRYSVVGAAGWLVDNKEPDYPKGGDLLRWRLLYEIEEVRKIRKEMQDRGVYISSLSHWSVDLYGKITFWLNPGGGEAMYGFYKLSELRGWRDGNPRSVVLERNHKKVEDDADLDLRMTFSVSLEILAKRRDKEGRRLFRVALQRCPYDDLVAKYRLGRILLRG